MKEIYLDLISLGWTLEAIDNMDFFYYLDLLIYNANKEENKDTQLNATIDQVL